MTTRLKEIVKKYGKVGLGVHFSVSALSITGLYIAIKSNVDVESLFEKYHLPGFSTKENPNPDPSPGPSPSPDFQSHDGVREIPNEVIGEEGTGKGNRTTELAASTGGALALAILCNKALLPIRVPITMALTPPLARFLARRKIIKTGV